MGWFRVSLLIALVCKQIDVLADLHVSQTALLSETPSRGSRQPFGAGILSGILNSSRENT